MQITRRHLLALSAGTAAAGALGTAAIGLKWWNQAPSAPYSVLTQTEADFVIAWSGIAFPHTEATPLSGDSAGLDRFFDGVLMRMPGTTASMLRMLLNGLNTASIATHGAPFTSLAKSAQTECFESWTHSNLAPLRSATQGLVLLLGMGWSTHPTVSPTFSKMHQCGYGS